MSRKKKFTADNMLVPLINPEPLLTLKSVNSLLIKDGCEFCFQFDDDEPVVFATSIPSEESYIQFKITNSSNSNIDFFDNSKNKKFKIFVREKK